VSFLISAVSWLFQLYTLLILARVVLTWVNPDPYRRPMDHPLVRLLNQVTDPVLVPLQKLIPPIGGTLDISPVAALIILEVVRRIVVMFLTSVLL
jgi:YggT family protein